jgi:hypothetical protein
MKRLGIFNNRAYASALESSISFLGLFTTPLEAQDFERFDKYLACKFEAQP